MKEKIIAETSISIDAPVSKVWKAITTPKLIKKYLFGTDVTTDWKEGSSITYKGEYEGKSYEDKGQILKIEPEKIFQSTYWSSMSGKEDKPENYATVTYKLSANEDKVKVTISQDSIENEESKKHSLENWKAVLKKLKEVVEE